MTITNPSCNLKENYFHYTEIHILKNSYQDNFKMSYPNTLLVYHTISGDLFSDFISEYRVKYWYIQLTNFLFMLFDSKD